MVGSKMNHLNKDSNSYLMSALLITTVVVVVAAAVLSSILITSNIVTPVAATTTTAGNNATTTITQPSSSSSSSEMIQLSPQPIYQGYSRTTSETPINQTHVSSTNSGNGTLTLPGTGQTINVTSNGRSIFSRMAQSGQGEVTITTTEQEEDDDGSEESATARFYEIVQFNFATGEGKGFMLAVFHTNSTGILAPLNGMVVAGIDHFLPNVRDNSVTLWEWESGIPLPTTTTTTADNAATTTNTTTTEEAEGEAE
jgi:hypothetical protein